MPTGPPVNTDAIDKKVWLVKVPKFVADKWAEIHEEGVELGRVRIYNKLDLLSLKLALIVFSQVLQENPGRPKSRCILPKRRGRNHCPRTTT